jgi:nitrogenase molybdenum-iron protein alpha chain
MDFVIQNTAPPREERLNAGMAFGGTCGSLKGCLGGGRCFNQAGRSFTQSYGCQFLLSLGMLNTIRKAVVIMHAPIGCGSCSISSTGTGDALKKLRDPQTEEFVWLSTNLDESAVIRGGESNLREAVLFADRGFRPEAIIVVGGCVPALIGDDIDTILDEGFKTKIMATAYDSVYNGIMKKLAKPPQKREYLVEADEDKAAREARLSRKVNIFNVGSMSYDDEQELKRLLNALGLDASFIPCYAEKDDFSYTLEAALNVSICGTHDDYYLQYLKEAFGMPYIIDTFPAGRQNTGRWIAKVAEFFGLQREAEQQENEILDKSLEPFRQSLAGKKAFISGGEVRVFATAEIIRDLNMEVVGLKGHHIDEFVAPVLETLGDIDKVPFNVANQHTFEHVNLVKRLEPDILIIHAGGNNVSPKLGLPLLPIYGYTYNYMGYSGVYQVARRISRLLQNGQFNKNIARQKRLPYREEWYGKNPFSYISGMEG